ncbi:MAG: hypothetical protein RBU21_12395 [FCB group bacterium]|jgi:hypothetical protein|nr:hypothetical protein [FCB group bacterium]
MSHIHTISRAQDPSRAESLLVWQQKAAVFGVLAGGLSTLATAFNVFTQATDRKEGEA